MKFKKKQNYGDRGQNSGYLCGGSRVTEKSSKRILGGRNEVSLEPGGGYKRYEYSKPYIKNLLYINKKKHSIKLNCED